MDGQFIVVLLKDLRGDANLDLNANDEFVMPAFSTRKEAEQWAYGQLSENDRFIVAVVVDDHQPRE